MTTTDYAAKYLNLLKMAVSICRNQDQAADIVQDLFVKLQEIQNKHGNLDHLSNNDLPNLVWCWFVMRNAFIDSTRNLKPSVGLVADIPAHDTTNDKQTQEEQFKRIEKAFNDAAFSDAELYSTAYFRLYAKSGLSYNELAKINKTTKWVVQRAVTNGKRIIKNKLKDE